MLTRLEAWQVLGLPAGTTPEEVKAAYLRLARENHPDVNPDPEAGRRMVRINEAYEVLSRGARLPAVFPYSRAYTAGSSVGSVILGAIRIVVADPAFQKFAEDLLRGETTTSSPSRGI